MNKEHHLHISLMLGGLFLGISFFALSLQMAAASAHQLNAGFVAAVSPSPSSASPTPTSSATPSASATPESTVAETPTPTPIVVSDPVATPSVSSSPSPTPNTTATPRPTVASDPVASPTPKTQSSPTPSVVLDPTPAPSVSLSPVADKTTTGNDSFIRGDVNQDGIVDNTDSLLAARVATDSRVRVECLDAVDADDNGFIDIWDSLYINNFLFTGAKNALPAPYSAVGQDPTKDSLTCDNYYRHLHVHRVDVSRITETSVMVKWITNIPANSSVVYNSANNQSAGGDLTSRVNDGLNFGVLTAENNPDFYTIIHEVVLNNLTPGTQYNFYVSSHTPEENQTVRGADGNFETAGQAVYENADDIAADRNSQDIDEVRTVSPGLVNNTLFKSKSSPDVYLFVDENLSDGFSPVLRHIVHERVLLNYSLTPDKIITVSDDFFKEVVSTYPTGSPIEKNSFPPLGTLVKMDGDHAIYLSYFNEYLQIHDFKYIETMKKVREISPREILWVHPDRTRQAVLGVEFVSANHEARDIERFVPRLARAEGHDQIWYLTDNQKRIPFPGPDFDAGAFSNSGEGPVFNSWFNAEDILTISQAEIESYEILPGSFIHIRPGVRFLRFVTDSTLYVVEPNGVLREASIEVIQSIYPLNQEQISMKTIIIDDRYVPSYTLGEPLALNEYPEHALVKSPTTEFIHIIQDGKARAFSEEALVANNIRREDVIYVNPVFRLDTLEHGSSVDGFEEEIAVPAVIRNLNNNDPDPIPDEPVFRRGDSNDDGVVDLSDMITTLSWLFLGTSDITCLDAADANDDGIINITDPLYTKNWLFLGTNDAPPSPGPFTPGDDPTEDRLGCRQYNSGVQQEPAVVNINIDASAQPSRIVLGGVQGERLSDIRIKSSSESADITQLVIAVNDGGIVGTAFEQNPQDNIEKFWLRVNGAVVGSASGYVMTSQTKVVNLNRGDLTIPEGSAGVRLSIEASLSEIGQNQPGQTNVSVKMGLADEGASIIAVGNNTGRRLAIQHVESLGSPVKIHAAAPQVVIRTPSNRLSAASVLHTIDITAVGGTVGLYKTSYQVNVSASLDVSNAFTRLTTCNGCGGVSNGEQLSAVSVSPLNQDGSGSIWSLAIDPNQAHGKNYLSILRGGTARIDLVATVSGLTPNVDSVTSRLLGDRPTTTGETTGAKATTFRTLDNGNFVWSDLQQDSSNGASALSSRQWFNGYLVYGLGTVTTSTSITVSE